MAKSPKVIPKPWEMICPVCGEELCLVKDSYPKKLKCDKCYYSRVGKWITVPIDEDYGVKNFYVITEEIMLLVCTRTRYGPADLRKREREERALALAEARELIRHDNFWIYMKCVKDKHPEIKWFYRKFCDWMQDEGLFPLNATIAAQEILSYENRESYDAAESAAAAQSAEDDEVE
jgi:hypothetical protein